MTGIENNATFWQKIDTILLSSNITIDRPKGTCHFKYKNLIYPVDYGFLSDTLGSDQAPIDIFVGSNESNSVGAIAISADVLKKDCEVKLLLGCSEEETLSIMEFLNQTEFQKAILIHRGNEIPTWANED